jgi:hypothetical protein
MDSNLVSAMIGLVGGLVGVYIGALLQHRANHACMCRDTTLQLYDRFDDSDLVESRIHADRILAANASAPQPQCYSELYASLSRDEWQHISRTRHFLDQVGLLHRIGYLDKAIAGPLFGGYVNYWVDRYFASLEGWEREYAAKTGARPHQWHVTSAELKKLFSNNSQNA